MRYLRGAAMAAAMALLVLSAPAPGAAAERSPDDGWRAVIYPVYGWLPMYRAETRLPEALDAGGGGGVVRPEGNTDSSLNQAILVAFRVEKGRFSLEGGYLYAGLSAEADRPLVKIEADTSLADLLAGYEVVPDLYIEGGARYLAINMKATLADYPQRSWEPDILEPVIGFSYRPLLGKNWRLVLHGDVGGVVTGDSTTATATARVEWQPAKHFLLTAGGTVMYLHTEGTIESRDVKLDQTLFGPVVGFGIPF
jgi:hypothetical protein